MCSTLHHSAAAASPKDATKPVPGSVTKPITMTQETWDRLQRNKDQQLQTVLRQLGSKEPGLVEVNWGYQDMGPDRMLCFVKALEDASEVKLERLMLGGNQIGDQAAAALANWLKHNNTVSTLYLYNGNNITDRGAESLGEMLKVNNSLTELYLWSNDIADAGATALAKGLEQNSTLTDLNLQSNRIEDIGGSAMAVMLRKNSTLVELNMYANQITDIGAGALMMGMKKNQTIKTLEVGWNFIDDDTLDELRELVQTNS